MTCTPPLSPPNTGAFGARHRPGLLHDRRARRQDPGGPTALCRRTFRCQHRTLDLPDRTRRPRAHTVARSDGKASAEVVQPDADSRASGRGGSAAGRAAVLRSWCRRIHASARSSTRYASRAPRNTTGVPPNAPFLETTAVPSRVASIARNPSRGTQLSAAATGGTVTITRISDADPDAALLHGARPRSRHDKLCRLAWSGPGAPLPCGAVAPAQCNHAL